jgi:hypothetical protein
VFDDEDDDGIDEDVEDGVSVVATVPEDDDVFFAFLCAVFFTVEVLVLELAFASCMHLSMQSCDAWSVLAVVP